MSTAMLLLHVADPAASADFYARLFGAPPVERSPGFVLFVMPSGLKLGLWQREAVVPASGGVGATELGLHVDTYAEVDAEHARWTDLDVAILMPPTDLDFGRCFVARDPDGHRLRVYAMAR